jgi:hypothetical protein
MATDPFVVLQTGAGQKPDAARFRVGSVKITVTCDGKPFNACALSLVYSDRGLPIANLDIPIGAPVGSLAGEESPNDLAKIKSSFKKFSRIEVSMEVAELPPSEDVGNILKPGTYKVFAGYVSSLRISHVGQSSVAVRIKVVHDLVKLANGSPLFSNIVSANGFHDLEVTYTGHFVQLASAAAAKTGGKPWDIMKAVAELAAGLSKAINASKPKGWTINDPEISKLVSEIKRSIELLSSVASKAEFKFSDATSLGETKRRIGDMVSMLLVEAKTSMNFIMLAARMAEQLYCSIVFTQKEGHFIPFDPLWKSSEMKVVRGGMAFTQDHLIGSGGGYVVEGYDITGTVALLPQNGRFYDGPGSVRMVYDKWFMPSASFGAPFTLVDATQLPSWLDPKGFREAITREILVKARPTSMATPPGSPGKTQTEAEDASTVGALKKLSREFSFFNTMTKNLGSSGLTVTLSLRDDIVPGMNLAVTTCDAEGSDYTLYGYVSSVSTVISADELRAHTQVDLRYVRGKTEQDMIDSAGIEHFAWKRVSDYLNGLRLWSPA